MSDDILELGDVNVSGLRLIEALTTVRTHVRKATHGKTVDGLYSVNVTTNGKTEVWTFDHTVGYPFVDGAEYDWHEKWLESIKQG